MKKNLLCLDFREVLIANATVDLNVWRKASWAIDDLESKYGKGGRLPAWHVSLDFYAAMPLCWAENKNNGGYVVNAYFVADEEIECVVNMYGAEDEEEDELAAQGRSALRKHILSNWFSLGYDVCTPDLAVSAIYSTGELIFAKKKYGNAWNEYGLVKNRDNCLEIIKDSEFHAHDGTIFIHVEIYTSSLSLVNR